MPVQVFSHVPDSMRWLEPDSPYGVGMDGERAAMALALAACIVAAGASTFLLLQDSEVGVSNDSESMVDPLLQDEGHDHRNASRGWVSTCGKG